MNIIVVCGFLNSGKTSVINHLTRYITESFSDSKMVYIQNEFGKVQIEQRDNVDIKELLTGCVCCSKSTDMLKLITEITNSDEPEWVVLEANGISVPQNIKELLFDRLGLKCKIVFIAEAPRWFRLKKATAHISLSQVEGSDIAIVNKCDLTDIDTVENVTSDIQEMNSCINVYTCAALSGLSEDILKAVCCNTPAK